MEKIMIFRDEAAAESWKEKRQNQNLDILKFGKQLKEDNIDLDQAIFRQFVSGGSGFIWSLLEKELEANAKKAGITSRIGKKNLMRGINERSEKYKEVHAKILASLALCGIQAKDITISQEKAILSKEELESKRQELSVFVETDDQLELWKLLQKGSEFFNDLEKFISKKQKLPSIFKVGSPDGLGDYIIFEKDSKFEIPESQERLGFMMPMAGGIICKPNHEAIEGLKSKNKS